jgi:hypothetical protein
MFVYHHQCTHDREKSDEGVENDRDEEVRIHLSAFGRLELTVQPDLRSSEHQPLRRTAHAVGRTRRTESSGVGSWAHARRQTEAWRQAFDTRDLRAVFWRAAAGDEDEAAEAEVPVSGLDPRAHAAVARQMQE